MVGAGLIDTMSGAVWRRAPSGANAAPDFKCKWPNVRTIATNSHQIYVNYWNGPYTPIAMFTYPFDGARCPRKPSELLNYPPTSPPSYTGAIQAMHAAPSGELYALFNGDYPHNFALFEYPNGSVNPVFLGSYVTSGGGLESNSLAIDRGGHVVTVYKGSVYVYRIVSGSGVLTLVNTIPNQDSGRVFGFALDADESHIYLANFDSAAVDVMTYDAYSGNGAYAYTFRVEDRPYSLAVSPSDRT